MTKRNEPFVVGGDLGRRAEAILYSPNYPRGFKETE
jgi:hypothetical protein